MEQGRLECRKMLFAYICQEQGFGAHDIERWHIVTEKKKQSVVRILASIKTVIALPGKEVAAFPCLKPCRSRNPKVSERWCSE